MDRRTFLVGASALSVALATRGAAAETRPQRILLLVELKGGNDGMNTLVPYADPLYRQFRPGIGVARERIIQLDERVGLHEKLEPLMESWKGRDLAIVQGVGYPYPNRSHFRSIEIWDTASKSDEYLDAGWLARAFALSPSPSTFAADGDFLDLMIAALGKSHGHDKERDQPPQKSIHRKSEDNTQTMARPHKNPHAFKLRNLIVGQKPCL